MVKIKLGISYMIFIYKTQLLLLGCVKHIKSPHKVSIDLVDRQRHLVK